MPVTIQYKTTKGSTWTTRDEAIVADALEQSSCYIQDYQIRDAVQAILDHCIVFERTETKEPIQNETN